MHVSSAQTPAQSLTVTDLGPRFTACRVAIPPLSTTLSTAFCGYRNIHYSLVFVALLSNLLGRLCLTYSRPRRTAKTRLKNDKGNGCSQSCRPPAGRSGSSSPHP